MHNPGNGFLTATIRSVGTAAMLLALTRTLSDEEIVKKMLCDQNYQFVVTEVGGNSSVAEFQSKVTRAVIGASLNSGIMSKSSTNYHALLHATEEAKRGIMVNVASSVSLAVKVAIVRDDKWIAVALFGDSALHPVTNHERAGMGIMHLGTDD
jgi:hut operon positive regulatory protein